jgi:molybdenum cofactor cytidylyltransferase
LVSDKHPRVAAIVLAAGMSTRMGSNKLIADMNGEPLVRHVVRAAESSRARPIAVVTGHDHKSVGGALTDTETTIVHNPDFRDGLSTSLRAGICALGECAGAIILLGDMPAISSSLIDRMIAAFDPADGRAICVATCKGQRGHPVLFARRFFPELLTISGDIGARQIIENNRDLVCEIEAENDGPLIDIDTREELERFARRP